MKIVLLMKNGQEIFTQLENAELLKPLSKKMNDGKMVVIGGSVYHGWDISRIMSEQDYRVYRQYEDEKELKREEVRLKNSGMWKCSYGHWHERGNECGHALQYPAGTHLRDPKKLSTPADTVTSMQKALDNKKKLLE